MSVPAAAPALAIVPPDAPPPTALSPADRERRFRRVRTLGAASCVTGALLPVACVAASPWLHGWEYLGIVVSFVLLVPCGGLALLICSVARRSREDVKAMLLAVAVFAGGIALLEPAANAGMEAYVSSHATELDALAARVRAAIPVQLTPDVAGPVFDDGDGRAPLRRALREHRLRDPVTVDGGMVFPFNDVPFVSALFYADEVESPYPFECRNLRAIGGRWYMGDCPVGTSDSMD